MLEGGSAVGDGAGLVQDDGGEPAGGLQCLAVADEDAELGGLAGADHDGGRGGQPQGAGAGDDEDGDGGADGQHQPVGAGAEGHPADEGRECGEQDGGHEPGGDLVGQPLHRGLGALGVLDQADDLGQGAVGADGVGADHEGAGAVRGGSDHLVAGPLVDRDGLAGEHRLVDGGRAVDDGAVDGNVLAGPDADEIADRHLLEGDVDLGAVAHDARGGGGEADQGLDGGGGALFGLELQPPTHQDQCDHDERGLEVQVDRQAPGLCLRGPEGDEGAVAEGDPRAERDQRVHGGGPVLRSGPRLPVDVGPSPQLDAGGDDQDERHQPVHGVDVQRQVHDAHQRQTGGQSDLPAALEVDDLGVAARVELVDRVRTRRRCRSRVSRGADLLTGRLAGPGCRTGGAGCSGVPGPGHCGGQRLQGGEGGVVGDGGGLVGEVDRGRDHAVDAGERLLDPPHT